MDYQDLIKIENLFQAWREFCKGKRNKFDVQIFEFNLEDNLFKLHYLLRTKTYRHGSYQEFYINDPKKRHIHKATIRDRIVHHLLYKYLYELFDKTFIYDSFSCRNNKGTHKGVKRLTFFVRKVSNNYTKPCWALKCDVKKFFASVAHQALLNLLRTKIKDENIIWLLNNVISSFEVETRKGIPLGNLTSQIFANIYMDKFDQFIKHELNIKYYIRYADDFIVLNSRKSNLLPRIDTAQQFLKEKLKLDLHPDKITLRKLSWGIDFLGYVIYPNLILPRKSTKKRLLRKIESRIVAYYKGEINKFSLDQTFASYTGYLSHANSYKLRQRLTSLLEDEEEGGAGEY